MSGNVQELAVKHVAIEDYSKSIVIYVAGRAASTCKRKGHANTISMGEMGARRKQG